MTPSRSYLETSQILWPKKPDLGCEIAWGRPGSQVTRQVDPEPYLDFETAPEWTLSEKLK